MYNIIIGLDKLCYHNFGNKGYVQECENNARIIAEQ